jgi:hypothetical protein
LKIHDAISGSRCRVIAEELIELHSKAEVIKDILDKQFEELKEAYCDQSHREATKQNSFPIDQLRQ